MKRAIGVVMVIGLCVPMLCSGEGLRGKTYIKGVVARIEPGEGPLTVFDDTLTGYGVMGNYPLAAEVDLMIGVQRVVAEGMLEVFGDTEITSDAYMAGIVLHRMCDSYEPYARLAYTYGETAIDPREAAADPETSSHGLNLSAGVDITVDESVVLTPYVLFIAVGDTEATSLRGKGLVWVADGLAAEVTIGYELDDEDWTYIFGLAGVL